MQEACSDTAQQVIQVIGRSLGDTAYLLRDFPRLTAYHIRGDEWSIVFVGSKQGCNEINALNFSGSRKNLNERDWAIFYLEYIQTIKNLVGNGNTFSYL